MIDETPGAGPDETITPAPAPETSATPAGDAPSSPETSSADAGPTEPPASPEDPAPSEPDADQSEAGAKEPDPQPLVHGADQVAEQVAHDQAQGFHGQEVDQTPNEDYTLPGVQAGEPTPENPEGSDAQ